MQIGRIVVVLLIAFGATALHGQEPLTLVRSIPLAGVRGRIDHMAIDTERHRLYVAALGNDTVEVVDSREMRRVKSITGFHEPQGIAVVPGSGLTVVANGEGGSVDVLDPATLMVTRRIMLGDDADNVRYDERTSHVFVGYGSGALAAIEPATGRRIAETPLRGHPESFQLQPSGRLAFVNVPSTRAVIVVDRETSKVTAMWPVTAAHANYPMALDDAGHRLFIGCRNPARLLVLDEATGRLLGSAGIVGDTDDLFFDAARHRVYVSGGEGFIDVLSEDGGRITRTARIQTSPGARTSLFVAGESRLYLAVPARDGHGAEVRVYEAH